MAHAPRPNEKNESRNSSVLEVLRNLKSELKWRRNEWSEKPNSSLIETSISNALLKSRSQYTANEIFLGVKKETIVDIFSSKKE